MQKRVHWTGADFQGELLEFVLFFCWGEGVFYFVFGF